MVSRASNERWKILHKKIEPPEGVRTGFETGDTVGQVVFLGRDVVVSVLTGLSITESVNEVVTS